MILDGEKRNICTSIMNLHEKKGLRVFRVFSTWGHLTANTCIDMVGGWVGGCSPKAGILKEAQRFKPIKIRTILRETECTSMAPGPFRFVFQVSFRASHLNSSNKSFCKLGQRAPFLGSRGTSPPTPTFSRRIIHLNRSLMSTG